MSFAPFVRPLLRPSPLQTFPKRAFSSSHQLAFARLTVLGTITAPPETDTLQTGTEIVRYSIVNLRGPDKSPDYFRVTYFPNARSNFQSALLDCDKGTKVLMEGDFSLSKYHNKEGVEKLGMNIIQRSLYIIAKKSISGNSEAEPEDVGQAEA